jgi:17beta-estradiol 17-dehydrogenase / very-long-chain 3-oxoacyl-CoA reductase
MNIYLISRTESKLAAAAAEIQEKYNVEAKYFVADLVASGSFTDAGAAWFGLQSNLESLDVGVLINNAGLSYEYPEYFHHLESKQMKDILAINSATLTQMIHVVLPGMKARGRGCVVNISSGVSAVLPACPLLAVYAASKAYVDSLTAALAAEYTHFGIRFQVCLRCVTASKANIPRTNQCLIWCVNRNVT